MNEMQESAANVQKQKDDAQMLRFPLQPPRAAKTPHHPLTKGEIPLSTALLGELDAHLNQIPLAFETTIHSGRTYPGSTALLDACRASRGNDPVSACRSDLICEKHPTKSAGACRLACCSSRIPS